MPLRMQYEEHTLLRQQPGDHGEHVAIKKLLDGNEFDFPKGDSLKRGGKRLVRKGEQGELGL